MASITIVSGSPGVGKSTLAHTLAARVTFGVHIRSDEFYYFIPNLMAPSSVEAHDQNITVLTAAIRAGATYATNNYDVYFDGVLGRWFLPLFARELRSTGMAVELIMLTAPLDDCLARARKRGEPGITPIVEKMHGEIARHLDGIERHVVDTTGLSSDEVVAIVDERRAAGDFIGSLDAWEALPTDLERLP